MSLIAICRLCLSSDKRTYIISNTVLQETWERLTNAKYDASDGRPIHACYICYAQLRRSYQLMQRAVKADELFRKYVINNGYEESKKLVSLIVSKTYEIDYNYDFEEQYNLEFIQDDTHEVEEVKEEKEVDNDVYIKMEKDDSSESNHEESDVENADTGIHSDDEDHIPIMRLKKTMQREIQIDLNKAHGIDIKVEKCNIGDVHETANPFEVNETNKTLCCEVEFILPSDNIGNLQRNICSTFDENVSLNNTTDDGSKKKRTTNKLFLCKLCEYQCYTKKSINIHIHNDHSGVDTSKCHYRLLDKNSLKPYRKFRHEEDKKNACNTCKKRFFKKTDLERHLRVHTGEKPFECGLCDYKTSDSGTLKRHLNFKHREEKDFECHVCQKNFVTAADLTRHVRVHTGEKPFVCDLCDYRTSERGSLARHVKCMHTREKDFACHICQKKFHTNAHLNRHMRVHTGEKPYVCDYCDHRAADNGNLRKHLKLKHSSEMDFSCSICQQKCVSKRHLNEHLHSKHTGEKPYECDLCDYRTAFKSYLRSHLKIKHDRE